jgi:hypothetical protein
MEKYDATRIITGACRLSVDDLVLHTLRAAEIYATIGTFGVKYLPAGGLDGH